jgi:hypothetical protein
LGRVDHGKEGNERGCGKKGYVFLRGYNS